MVARASATCPRQLHERTAVLCIRHAVQVAAVALVGGVVHFKGAVASGSSGVLFTLPSRFRPAKAVYAKVDLCGATNGRLFIQPTGVVTVQQQSGDPFSNAQCFTSLDRVSFAP